MYGTKFCKNFKEDFFNFFLNRTASLKLGLPARKLGAVVFDGEFEVSHNVRQLLFVEVEISMYIFSVLTGKQKRQEVSTGLPF